MTQSKFLYDLSGTILCGHTTRKYYAKGLCRSCYALKRDRDGLNKITIAVCHGCKKEKRILSANMCSSCFNQGRKNLIKTNLLRAQDHKCAIVGCRTDTSQFTLTDWHLDHDHRCHPEGGYCIKCVRGVLCKPCNILLGNAKDSIGHLFALIDYLREKP